MIQRTRTPLAFIIVSIAAVSMPTRAVAQETQLDMHGNFSVTTDAHTKSWGAGIGPQFTFGASAAPVKLSVSPGFDYLKQEDSGPSQESVSLDVNLQPGGSRSVTPYVGGSTSANWSSGSGKQWEGAKLGLETMGGVQVKLGDAASLKVEERFGYVDGQSHSLTTRVGALLQL